MVIIDLGNPSHDSLEQMFQISRHVPRPVAMFVDQSDASMIEAAVEAGVSAQPAPTFWCRLDLSG